MTTSQTNDNHTHWAFISYRHADNKEQDRGWASWLHQEIERYEVPAELVGTKNKRGDTIPERIYPVFRDEESLPADADLANSISIALDKSRFLAVLCSPRAVESQYVAQEIEHFKKSGKSDRIIGAIIAGEPGDKDNECFPLALREIVTPDGKLSEPIAADFRLPDGSEGFTSAEAYKRELLKSLPKKQADKLAEIYDERLQLMKLKIIAGILGKPLEILRDRDKAYQLTQQKKRARQLRKWLTVVSVLALISAGAGYLAWQKQLEAERQESVALNARQRSDLLISQLILESTDITKACSLYIKDLPPELKNSSETKILRAFIIIKQAEKHIQTTEIDYYSSSPSESIDETDYNKVALRLCRSNFNLLESVPNSQPLKLLALSDTNYLFARALKLERFKPHKGANYKQENNAHTNSAIEKNLQHCYEALEYRSQLRQHLFSKDERHQKYYFLQSKSLSEDLYAINCFIGDIFLKEMYNLDESLKYYENAENELRSILSQEPEDPLSRQEESHKLVSHLKLIKSIKNTIAYQSLQSSKVHEITGSYTPISPSKNDLVYYSILVPLNEFIEINGYSDDFSISLSISEVSGDFSETVDFFIQRNESDKKSKQYHVRSFYQNKTKSNQQLKICVSSKFGLYNNYSDMKYVLSVKGGEQLTTHTLSMPETLPIPNKDLPSQ